MGTGLPTPVHPVLLFALAVVTLASCSGDGPAEDPRAGVGDPVVAIQASDAEVFRASISFGLPRRETIEAGGETWTRVLLPGLDSSIGRNGQPGVPILTRLVAVPLGATVAIEYARPVVAETLEVNLYPNQAFEGEFSPAFDHGAEVSAEEKRWRPPFAKDESAYARAIGYPSEVATVATVGRARDLRMAVLEIAAGRYDVATRELELFSSVDVGLRFEGGPGEFLPSEARNPFDGGSRALSGAPANWEAVHAEAAFVPANLMCHGEELLILSPPEYLPAAERLASFKRGIGLPTGIVVVNDGFGAGPDTKEQIDAFLDDRFNSCVVRFSYVLLLGDADDIEPWELSRDYKAGKFPSDFPYAQIDTDPEAGDLFPDVAVGRIPVNTLAQAERVVDKIIDYESDPPRPTVASPFYDQAAIASFFQCCDPAPPAGEENYRRFIQDSEEVLAKLTNQGFAVTRIYTTDAGDTAPRYYTDGVTPLPPPLRPEDGFAWDGDTQDIADVFNQGRLLFFHVDHGAWTGWVDPRFYTDDLQTLTNGDRLPVVISDNCSSGAFDFAGAGFAESILRMSGGGAIGVLAFTRGSNNTVGRRLLQGILDALWPDSYPSFGDDLVRHRLGDMLNHARARIALDAGSDPTADSYKVALAYVRMLSLFGDPTLAVWTESPYELMRLGRVEVVGRVIEFGYPLDGTVVTALEPTADGLAPIGRGVVREGVASLRVVVPPRDASRIRYYGTRPGGISSDLTPVPVGN